VEFSHLEEKFTGPAKSQSKLIGNVRKVYLAHATDEKVRQTGASGGVVTALLLDMLEQGTIDGAFLFSPEGEVSWKSEGRVVRTKEEIILSSQSRYYLSPMNIALSRISDSGEKIAYVGLPCHVHGLRKAQVSKWKPNAELSPVIGIYCGNNLFFEATRALLRKMGVKDLEEVNSIKYREGPWPGNFYVRKKDSTEARISKLEFNQAIPFFINKRCLLCIDLTNELTDISVRDGWMKEGDEKEGWSIVITRTELGDRIVEQCIENGSIHIEEITVKDAELMHSHAFDLKKVGSFLRIAFWKRLNLPVPTYDRKPPPVKAGRKVIEFFISLQFLIFSSRIGRVIFNFLPLGFTGSFFKRLRIVWMKFSKH